VSLNLFLVHTLLLHLVNRTHVMHTRTYQEIEDPLETAGVVIEAIADKLHTIGMLDVDSRPTARIPIVLFKVTTHYLALSYTVHVYLCTVRPAF
jgi:hypothetical protein